MIKYGSMSDSCISNSKSDGLRNAIFGKQRIASVDQRISFTAKSIQMKVTKSQKHTGCEMDISGIRPFNTPTYIAPPTLAINFKRDDSKIKDSISLIKPMISTLTSRKILTIFILSVANFSNSVAFSCIAPFYPGEAKLKGLNQSEIGIIFGIFELVIFISAPVFGKYMTTIGSKTMFNIGLTITGGTSFLFGFLNLLPSGAIFFWTSFITRAAEALGNSAFLTSSFVIATYSFPNRISSIVALLEMFSGLGYAVGPALGGVLYQYGGFSLPFMVLGALLILAAGLSYYLVEKCEPSLKNSGAGVLSLLKIPSIILIVSANMMCAFSLSFIDPTLAEHMESFSLSPMLIGLMFLLMGGMYAITAPFWGYLIDHRKCARSLMLFGSIFLVFSMLIIGPMPLLPFDKSLYSISASLIIMGFAVSALYIPTFKCCLETAIDAGCQDNLETYGIVSGLFQSTFSLGGFFGPTFGSISVQYIGFEWSTTIIALMHFIVVGYY